MSNSLVNTILLLAICFIFAFNFNLFCKNDSTDSNRLLLIREGEYAFSNITRSIKLWSQTTSSPLIPPFIPFRSTFVISSKYSLAACRIQKNLSTILLNLFCFLNTPRKFNKNAPSLTIEFRNHISVETCNSTHAAHIAYNTSFSTKLAILRDPVERFLSGFVDKCIHEAERKDGRCYGCDGDMICVLQEQYKRFLLIADGKLSNFSYEDRHFAPMSWFCDFDSETLKNYRFLYFGETEELQKQTIDQLMRVFIKHGVEEKTVSHILTELSANRTKHSTSGSKIREKIGQQMRRNNQAMQLLYLIYENDYKTFNLKSPF